MTSSRCSTTSVAGGRGLGVVRKLRRRSGAVLLVSHVLAPVDRGAGVVGLLHGEVGHEAVRRRAVPVVLARLEEDDVSGTEDLDGASAALAQSGALRYVDRLA